jgi:DNA polymerase-1
MTTLLIDADGIAYQCAAAFQTSIDWGDGVVTNEASLQDAQNAFTAAIEGFREQVDTDADVLLCWSCPTRRYFRHRLLPTYKGNRKGTKPIVLGDLRAWAEEGYPSKHKPDLEADDVIGILATHPKLVKDPIIVSGDKDLQQIPGLHINVREPGVFRVQPEFAEKWLWTQVLTGDSTDNYNGIPGVGPVKAEKILKLAFDFDDEAHDDTSPNYPLAVLHAYEKAGLTADDMAVQVNVARILQTPHYNFKRKEPILWQI